MTLLVVSLAIRLAVALILVISALHQLRIGPRFAGIIADFRILPRRVIAVFAAALPWMEFTAAVLLPWISGGLLVVLPALLLLLCMSSAIAINLMRGRRSIDCGCGTSRAGAGEGLSSGLLLRNGALMLLLILSAHPLLPASLGADGTLLSLITAAVFTSLFYIVSQLITNAQRSRQLLAARH